MSVTPSSQLSDVCHRFPIRDKVDLERWDAIDDSYSVKSIQEKVDLGWWDAIDESSSVKRIWDKVDPGCTIGQIVILDTLQEYSHG